MQEKILVSMEKTLLKNIDSSVKKFGYSSRSEFLRDAARTLISMKKGALHGKPRTIDEEKLVDAFLKKNKLSWQKNIK